MNTIAVLSDIHGNILALEAVAADIQQRKIKTVLNLGDHLSGPLWPKETIQFLMKQNWINISGNHDRYLIAVDPRRHGLSDKYAYQFLTEEEKEWLRALPTELRLNDDLFLFHGTPSSDSEYLLETVEHGRGRLATQAEIKQRLWNVQSPVMLCGHSHIARIVTIDDAILIVNPGSVGLPAFDDTKPMPHIMESGSPHARYATLESKNGTWGVEQILISYDHTKAAEQAQKNKRDEWAYALQTGFMPNR